MSCLSCRAQLSHERCSNRINLRTDRNNLRRLLRQQPRRPRQQRQNHQRGRRRRQQSSRLRQRRLHLRMLRRLLHLDGQLHRLCLPRHPWLPVRVAPVKYLPAWNLARGSPVPDIALGHERGDSVGQWEVRCGAQWGDRGYLSGKDRTMRQLCL